MSGGMVGRFYVDGGRRPGKHPLTGTSDDGRPRQVVRVLVQWNGRGPRNVLVQPTGVRLIRGEPYALTRDVGAPYVRPARGLRKLTAKDMKGTTT